MSPNPNASPSTPEGTEESAPQEPSVPAKKPARKATATKRTAARQKRSQATGKQAPETPAVAPQEPATEHTEPAWEADVTEDAKPKPAYKGKPADSTSKPKPSKTAPKKPSKAAASKATGNKEAAKPSKPDSKNKPAPKPEAPAPKGKPAPKTSPKPKPKRKPKRENAPQSASKASSAQQGIVTPEGSPGGAEEPVSASQGSKRPSGRGALQHHRLGECGCSMSKNPHNCPYQTFLDGWDFTTEVGNGKTRGEIFTPRFVIDQMLLDLGMFNPEALTDLDYDPDPQAALRRLSETFYEPAIGTGNFTSTILWHKLEYAAVASRDEEGNLSPERYDLNTLIASGSVYANDIDPGNLTTTILRLLGGGKIETQEHIARWVNRIMPFAGEHEEATVRAGVEKSLEIGQRVWGNQVEREGVLYQQYRKHVGRAPDFWLRDLWEEILWENIKVFNGISTETLLMDGNVVPGWHGVEWTRWGFEPDEDHINITRTPTSMMKQVYLAKARECQDRLARVVAKGDLDEKGKITFADPKDKKAYAAVKKEIREVIAIMREHNPDLEAKMSKAAIERTTLPQDGEEYDLFASLLL